MPKGSNIKPSFSHCCIVFFLICLTITAPAISRIPAFPGAEGFGRYTTGGRGGQVYYVTNLNDNGPGSLRQAVETPGKRTILFRVSGHINLNSPLIIRESGLTLAGQTAPGDGICIKNYPVLIKADNIIIRYIRVRPGDKAHVETDAISCVGQKDILVDHCSFSWGNDEVASFWNNENSSVQWCLISESLHHSAHHKGPHGYGGIWGGMGASFHHNCFAHHASRTPRFNGSRHQSKPVRELTDFRNNVIYNWGFNSSYGGEGGRQNIIANYYKAGPASRHRNRIVEPYDAKGKWYVAENRVHGFPKVTADNWAGGVQGKHKNSARVDTPFQVAPVATQTPEQAYEQVLQTCGAIFPKRDSLDKRIIREIRTGTATYGGKYGEQSGIIDSQTQVGGWPELHCDPAPPDRDQDGLPDVWEDTHGLDPDEPADSRNLTPDGYTVLEQYLNSLVNE
ncbi:MAG: pectate lyase [candidate division KSB1 bacterium]|nr:pectate lyase [candidate division KSB1 bacterium]